VKSKGDDEVQASQEKAGPGKTCKPIARRKRSAATSVCVIRQIFPTFQLLPRLINSWHATCSVARAGFRIIYSSTGGFIMKQLKRYASLFSGIALVTMVGCSGSPTKESTAEYVDDSLITTKVKAAIAFEPATKATQINVETFKGTVQLSGFVATRYEIDKAAEVTYKVAGVKAVKNDIRLR
jgi:hypothetical protein